MFSDILMRSNCQIKTLTLRPAFAAGARPTWKGNAVIPRVSSVLESREEHGRRDFFPYVFFK